MSNLDRSLLVSSDADTDTDVTILSYADTSPGDMPVIALPSDYNGNKVRGGESQAGLAFENAAFLSEDHEGKRGISRSTYDTGMWMTTSSSSTGTIKDKAEVDGEQDGSAGKENEIGHPAVSDDRDRSPVPPPRSHRVILNDGDPAAVSDNPPIIQVPGYTLASKRTYNRQPPNSSDKPPIVTQDTVRIPMEGTEVEVNQTAQQPCEKLEQLQGHEHPVTMVEPTGGIPDYSHTCTVAEPVGIDESKIQEVHDYTVATAGCCSCCYTCCFTCCLKRHLRKVTPKQVEKLQKTVQKQHDVANSPEYNPPEGKNLYFDDGKRRIDYILAWKISDKQETEDDNADCRTIFTRNLEEEGLHLEYTEPDQKEVYYLKIHAPYEVLTRYAEITKTRMPIKELPQQHQPDGFLEVMSVYVSNLLSPFDLNPLNVPPIPKKYTSMFERNKEYLFDIPDNKELFFSHGIRSRLVDYILRRKRYVEDQHDYYSFGIKQLLSKDVYDAAYPLHEGDYQTNSRMNMRRLLHDQWSSWRKWYKRQPLNHIRVYFGEKIGFYFAWLGFYTYSLLPASIVGLLVFIYGCSTISLNVSVQEGCDWNNNFTMCPLCNKRCPYWNYASVCGHMEATHIFDNSITVIFALFMSLWGTLFLEFWKREQAELQFKWNVSGFEEEEETPRPEYLAKMSRSKHKRTDAVTGESEPYIPAKNKIPIYCVSITTMALLVIVAVAVVIAIIVYRMAVAGALILQEKEVLYNNAPMVTSSTAAIIQLIAIIILTVVYNKVAVMLTDWECPRTDTDYDNSLTFKLYLLQFVNYYSSLFYIAFFKGRFRTNPGDYSALQSEQCSGGGCLIDLCIQLGIIFVGKMLIQNNFMEIFLPRIIAWFKGCCASDDFDPEQAQPWEEDRQLKHRGKRALFDEYLEMLLQFGFVTLFVAAFPLAPFFAWLNNIIEIRADANKFVAQYRRPVAMRAETIGVWYNVLVGVSRLAILTNAFIIAITSGFVHRMVYLIEYSEDGRLTGYTNYTLSYFNVSDYHEDSVPDDPDGEYQDIELCRYRDYREPPWADNQYEYTSTFWNVLAAQFIFVVVFENLVILITVSIAFFIPDVPSKLQQQIRREAYITNEIILKTELKITRGEDAELSEKQRATIRRRTTALGSVPPPDTDTFTELHTIAESNV